MMAAAEECCVRMKQDPFSLQRIDLILVCADLNQESVHVKVKESGS
jgi:hypothetical protein